VSRETAKGTAPRRTGIWVVVALAVLAAAIIAGCGSDDDNSSS
jgi:hypothetical protein